MKKLISVIVMLCILLALLPTNVFAEKVPMIATQPQTVTLRNGEDAVYTVGAVGEDLKYQWHYFDGRNAYVPLQESPHYSGVQTNTLTVRSMQKTNGGYDCVFSGDQYLCVVSNAEGAVVSEPAAYMVADHAKIYAYDRTRHWTACGCLRDERAHVDRDEDARCDVCGLLYVHPFVDVTDPNVWYYAAAEYGRWKGYFNGDPEGRFNGNAAITRAEVAAVIVRSFDEKTDPNAVSEEAFDEYLAELAAKNGRQEPISFSDLEGRWYQRYVLILANLGIITGYENGTFKGDQPITRQEIAAVLYRYYRYASAGTAHPPKFGPAVRAYTDAERVAPWAKPYVDWSAETGLFQGDLAGNFNPISNATRAEFAQLLVRFDSAESGV